MWDSRKARPRGIRTWIIAFLLCVLVGLGMVWWGGGLSVSSLFRDWAPEQGQPDGVVTGTRPKGDVLVGAPASRRMIYDRNYHVLALSFPVASISVKPLEVRSVDETVQRLSGLLELDPDGLLQELKQERTVVWLKKNMPVNLGEQARQLGLDGVYVATDMERFYPEGNLAAHAIGYLADGQGISGAELLHDGVLRGDRAAGQGDLAPGVDPSSLPEGFSGASVVLTIDVEVQRMLEKELAKLAGAMGTVNAAGLLMDARSGAILAAASQPVFDPNVFWLSDDAARGNKVQADQAAGVGMNRYFQLAEALAAKAAALEGFMPEETAAVVLEPRATKRRIAKEQPVRPGRTAWFRLHQGLRISPWQEELELVFSAVPPEDWPGQGVGCGGSESGLGIGLTNRRPRGEGDDAGGQRGAGGLDLARVLARLNAALNGGICITPHLLSGLLLEEDVFIPTRFPAPEAAKGRVDGELFGELIARISPPGYSQTVILEGMSGDFPPDATEQVESASSGPERTTVVSPVSGAELTRAGVLLLAAYPRKNPALLFALAFEDAEIDLQRKSPLRAWAEGFGKQTLRHLADRTQRPAPPVKQEYNAVYQRWAEYHRQRDAHWGEEKKLVQHMPDLMGKSLRKALQALQDFSCEIRVEGGGRVISQKPAPGTDMTKQKACVLRLKREY